MPRTRTSVVTWGIQVTGGPAMEAMDGTWDTWAMLIKQGNGKPTKSIRGIRGMIEIGIAIVNHS